jgi:hypothetical protein
MRIDPRSGVGRRNIEIVTGVVVRRMAVVTLLDAWLVTSFARGLPELLARLVPALVVVAAIAFGFAFLRRLSGSLRRHVVRVALRGKYAVASWLALAAAGCVIAGAFLPSTVHLAHVTDTNDTYNWLRTAATLLAIPPWFLTPRVAAPGSWRARLRRGQVRR